MSSPVRKCEVPMSSQHTRAGNFLIRTRKDRTV